MGVFKENLIPAELTPQQVNFVYASEADVLNMALFGMTAKQWREANPGEKGNIRDFANGAQLVCLANMESLNAHFINEARYKGAYVVTITPDLSPSAIHSDEWVPVNIGADAALALSMAQVIVEEKLYKPDFMVEQTDMPLLVRLDTEQFLRESDMRRKGDDDVFYVFDTIENRVVEAPKRNLKLGDLEPALEGVYDVETRDGMVEVYMHGACSGCPGSTATLKHGIEARLREEIPEVEGVVAL